MSGTFNINKRDNYRILRPDRLSIDRRKREFNLRYIVQYESIAEERKSQDSGAFIVLPGIVFT
jgi:hypothetical protein